MDFDLAKLAGETTEAVVTSKSWQQSLSCIYT